MFLVPVLVTVQLECIVGSTYGLVETDIAKLGTIRLGLVLIIRLHFHNGFICYTTRHLDL